MAYRENVKVKSVCYPDGQVLVGETEVSIDAATISFMVESKQIAVLTNGFIVHLEGDDYLKVSIAFQQFR